MIKGREKELESMELRGCNICRATKITADVKWARKNPCCFCDYCYSLLHWNNESLLYGEFSELVSQFQNTTDEETKEKIAANLANFAYDPYNYSFLRQLNVLELFLDCITEPNEKLVEFGIGGICNSCVDPANAAILTQCDGIPLVIQCLSSPVRNTVNYALGALYYLCNKSNREEILKPEVVDVIERYAAAQTVNVSFSNLAKAFLDKHVSKDK